MRYLIAILLFLPVGLMANTGSFYGYSIRPDSWVSIQGTTNVNSFECVSDNQMPQGYIMTEPFPGNDGILFSDAMLELEVASFDCQNRRMNRDFQNALGGQKHPYIRVRLIEAEHINGKTPGSDQLLIKVAISLNGKTKNTQLTIDLDQGHGQLFLFTGSKELNMSDFGVDPPSPALGIIKVRDNITINFNLKVEASLISRN